MPSPASCDSAVRLSLRLNTDGTLRGRSRPRKAAIAVELLFAVPLLIIGLFAIVQFGIYFTKLQGLSLAARDGAKAASETPPGSLVGPGVPANVTQAVIQQLVSCGIDPCAIILQHNVGGGPVQTLRTDGAPPCPGCDAPPGPPFPAASVRVTICTPFTEMMPNVLQSFGFDISGHFAQRSTTYAHEL